MKLTPACCRSRPATRLGWIGQDTVSGVAVDTHKAAPGADLRQPRKSVAPRLKPERRTLPRKAVTEVGRYHRSTMPAGKALVVVMLALVLGGLLNVRSLTDAAERQPNGWERDVALVLVWPFQQVSELLGLDRPQARLTERLGREEEVLASGDEPVVTTGGGDVDVDDEGNPDDPLLSDALAVAAAIAGREAVDPSLANVTAIPAGLDPDAPALRRAPELPERLQAEFVPAKPLRIAVIGDSLTEQLGPAIIDYTVQPEVPAVTTHDFTYSSGLSRPDFYDWPAQALSLAEELDPDLWIVMLGANDAQDIRADDGKFRQIGSDEWEAIYRERAGALMDLLTQDGRAVIWVGQPLMRASSFDESMEYVSSLYRQEAQARSLVSYVDAREVFAGPDGGYADYLPGSDGQLTQMRLSDGIHLTRAGAKRLADQVIPLLPVSVDPDAVAVPAVTTPESSEPSPAPATPSAAASQG